MEYISPTGSTGNINKCHPLIMLLTKSNGDTTLISNLGKIMIYIMK